LSYGRWVVCLTRKAGDNDGKDYRLRATP